MAERRVRTDPLLVGGTGRSGSTILGRFLGQHPQLHLTNPEELRFVANDHGVAEALAFAQMKWPRNRGAKDRAADAAGRCSDEWFYRDANTGLHTSMTLAQMKAATQGYVNGFGTDALAATQNFVDTVMSFVLATSQGRRWIDGSPANARVTDWLQPIWPQCQVIAIIRDGRDVAASFVQQDFGPDDIFDALEQWFTRMKRMHTAVQRCTPGRILTIDMMDFVMHDRAGTVNAVCEFAGLAADEQWLAWFDEHVTADAAHIGRWRSQFDQQTLYRLDARYAQMCIELRTSGYIVPKDQ